MSIIKVSLFCWFYFNGYLRSDGFTFCPGKKFLFPCSETVFGRNRLPVLSSSLSGHCWDVLSDTFIRGKCLKANNMSISDLTFDDSKHFYLASKRTFELGLDNEKGSVQVKLLALLTVQVRYEDFPNAGIQQVREKTAVRISL